MVGSPSGVLFLVPNMSSCRTAETPCPADIDARLPPVFPLFSYLLPSCGEAGGQGETNLMAIVLDLEGVMVARLFHSFFPPPSSLLFPPD